MLNRSTISQWKIRWDFPHSVDLSVQMATVSDTAATITPPAQNSYQPRDSRTMPHLADMPIYLDHLTISKNHSHWSIIIRIRIVTISHHFHHKVALLDQMDTPLTMMDIIQLFLTNYNQMLTDTLKIMYYQQHLLHLQWQNANNHHKWWRHKWWV